jgi:hypothetical protein
MMAREAKTDPKNIDDWLRRLSENRAPERVVSLLQEIVPEFDHQRDNVPESKAS